MSDAVTNGTTDRRSPAETLPPNVAGRLISGTRETLIEAKYASRYSVWVTLEEGAAQVGDDYSGLVLSIQDQNVDLGSCRVVEVDDSDARRIRLVPYGHIHDFERLFFKAKRKTLESAVMNLPLVLSYKESIDPVFKEFVSDLTYDLSAYRNALDRLDEEYADELPDVREIVQEGIFRTVGPDLLRHLDNRFAELVRITSKYTEKEHEHHGFYFRKQLWNIILCSPIMARTNLKPRGYSGDSEMMRMIYHGGYQGDSSFGKLLHKHSMDQPAAVAVRNRRRDIAELLHAYVEDRRMSGGSGLSRKIKMLSVACGPAFEVRDIVTTQEEASLLHLSLLDQDEQALLEASTVVRDVEHTLGAELSVDFVRESVRTMLVTRELQERWGRFDFIYSMGLFDYLTAPVATAVLRKLYQLLLPGGQMVIGNFSTENPTRYYMEYWLDWKIIYRTEQDLTALASRLPGADISVKYDATRIQMLLFIRRGEADEQTGGI